ncbi:MULTISPECIES: HlyD family secretion protein [unclassified Janthinobacterium]|uniref:efflux RND transporter periplasmic adaptor subunit n=1 Tax=unclassified Janthinobacterium TaxID=2610881 RepID=UPI0018C9738F|nr:HlyD family secretion protein [Janthinobacterium sp. CG_23.4]MDH6159691.1 multidrug efflux pump subunit AcrA (membrane-fusion protein) [Janthinobacterium sp. CG_23.4]
MRRSEWALKWLLPAIAVLLIGYAAWQALSRRPNEVVVAPAIAPTAAPNAGRFAMASAGTVAGTGLIEPSSEAVELAPALGGIVRSVAVVPGSQVSAGQLLVQLDDRDAVADLAFREAALITATRNTELSVSDLKDKQTLLTLYEAISDPRARSREELLRRQGAATQAEARARLAEAQQDEAAASLNVARVRISQFALRSPSDATVLQVRARPGQYAATGALGQTNQSLLTIGRIAQLHVRVDIDEADISRLGPIDVTAATSVSGLTVMVSPRGAAGSSVKGVFVRVEPLVKPKQSLNNAADERVDTRVLQLIFKLPQGTTGLFVGQQVDAYVTGSAPGTAQ